MNRPERPEYCGLDLEWSDYVDDLEEYSDALEKALDTACDRLEFVCEHKSTCSNCPLSVCPMLIFEISAWEYLKDKKKWMKEWCLKDE